MGTLMSRRAALVPSLMVAGSAVMWGLWWIPLRALDDAGLSGFWVSVALFASASAMLLPVAWARRARFRGAGRRVLAVGMLFGGALVAWNHALILGDVVRVTLLFYLAPIWGTILGIAMLGIRPSRLRLGTILMGLCGAAVVLGFEGGVPLPRGLADWMGLAAGFLFALGTAVVHKTGQTGDIEHTVASFVSAAVLAVLLAMAVPLDTPPQWAAVRDAVPLLVAVMAFWYVPITWMIIWAAARLDPGRVSILLLIEVGVAALSASLMTDEPFGWREAVGGTLIMAAGALEAYDGMRRHSRRIA